jgi:hypothetical protein
MVVNKGRIKNAVFSILFQGGEENELIGSIVKTLEKFNDRYSSENANIHTTDITIDELYEVDQERVNEFMKNFDLNQIF